jgi:hypothetical protein
MIAPRHLCVLAGFFPTLLLSLAALAQESAASEKPEPESAPEIVTETDFELDVPEDAMSGSLDDSSGSIEVARETAGNLIKQGWTVKGDLRVGYVRAENGFVLVAQSA